MIECTIPGLHGKDRPRMTRTGHVYTPPATKAYEDKVRWCWRTAAKGAPPLTGPVAVTLKAYCPIPKGTAKYKILQMLAKLLRPLTKPDLDNIIKIALDALNTLAYDDDKQVVEIHAYKLYAEGPGALYLRVEEATP